MAFSNTQTVSPQPNLNEFDLLIDDDETARRRLEVLLSANAETARTKRSFGSDADEFEASLMPRPLSSKQAFSYFGLMLGVFTPATMFGRLFLNNGMPPSESWVIGILLIINVVSAVVGYFSGKLIGQMVSAVEKYRWPTMLALLPVIGILWGFMAGGAGGFIVFIIGSVFGAILGAAVGAVAVPAFTLFHRLLKRGDMIETKHFLPLAFGLTFAICSFILGLK
ncbi:MAG: hypothetical protein ABI999_13400 [Acidobacteriota bacterium]